ncbi:MAG: NAD(P)-dependent oxidoreductase [bacterium]|nr:NAD(P)-dependent oxidoreductase [bacterium]
MNKKIILTGTTGMVGHYIDTCDWHAEIVKTTHQDFDIADLKAVANYFDHLNGEIEIIIHMAAETDVDRCEKEFNHAHLINAVGTKNMILQALKYDVPLLYISTVGIFGGDGQLGPFHELSNPCPANVYGLTKLYGEAIVKNHLSKYFIVRPGWMMGGVKKDKKFVMKIVKQILDGKKEIFAIDEIIGSPTYSKELIRTVSQLIKTDLWGIYHCTNNGKMSRYEVAKFICEQIDPSIKVTQVKSDYFNLPAPRAISEYSENRMLNVYGLNTMSSVQDALKAYIDEIKAELFNRVGV